MQIFFDLDGTLTDSSPGIVRCINYALETLGHDPAKDDVLRPMIGTPLSIIFADVLSTHDEATIDRAIAAYRERFNDVGMFENSLFPGTAAALETLTHGGHALQVVTAKPAVAARRILEHFEVQRVFGAVHGPELTDRSCDKAELIGAALRFSRGNAGDAAMVGDRAEDMLGARAHGVHSIAAGWGYGSRQELVAARPDFVAEHIDAVVDWVNRR